MFAVHALEIHKGLLAHVTNGDGAKNIMNVGPPRSKL